MFGGVMIAGCRSEPCDEAPPVSEDPEAFELLGGRVIEPTLVELAFSQPLDVIDAVDPGKFRLTAALVTRSSLYGTCYADTMYCDLSRDLYPSLCGYCEPWDGYGAGPYDEGEDLVDQPACETPTAVVGLALDPGDASRLRLTIAPPLRTVVCEQVAYFGDDASIVVHFVEGDDDTITAIDGRRLASIAPMVPGRYDDPREDGVFPNRAHVAPIVCPEVEG